jgi:pyruvate dehydrogenase E2 component (dihydrolipoamide acetyltransferase)/2-oxoisovalerate dehydrogenase E2 component (dihydrolipoyl transacylase)
MDFALPEIGEGVYEAELVRWLVQPGDAVKRGQDLAEVMTDKATMTVPSPFVGTISELKADPGRIVKVGETLLSYRPVEQATPAETRATHAPATGGTLPAAPPTTAMPANNGPTHAVNRLPVKAAPSVRVLARKLGVDLEHVRGSGPEGRVLLEDLSTHIRPAGGDGSAVRRTPEARPDYGTPGSRIKLVGLRRTIAEHMARATRTIPHYGYVDECDVTDLVRLRDSLKDVYARAGVKLTYLAFFVKAAAEALKEVPLVNASLDEAAGEIVLHDRYHIGIAVMTNGGLMVPVVRDADRKDVGAIAREIERLSQDARSGKAKREDLRGSTFSISSVGNLGGLFSTPVINHPEVGILGLARVVRRPVFDEHGQVRAADMMYLSFSFDHRVVDGAVGATFANAIIKRLRVPAALLITPPTPG